MDTLRRRLLTALLLARALPASAQLDAGESEARVKAAFVYRFTSYIDWPQPVFRAADAPFVIGVLGSEPLFNELGPLLAKRRIHERGVELRQLQAGDALNGLHLLFVGREFGREQAALLQLPPPLGLLVITESEGGMPRGSVINFLLVERRVRFEIALGNAEKAGLRLSSRLLTVAQKVHAGEGG